VNKEIKRRTDVVGVFPNPATLLRQAARSSSSSTTKWDAGERRYFSDASMQALTTMNPPTSNSVEEVVAIPELTAA
jgi:Transposase, Mutator family.